MRLGGGGEGHGGTVVDRSTHGSDGTHGGIVADGGEVHQGCVAEDGYEGNVGIHDHGAGAIGHAVVPGDELVKALVADAGGDVDRLTVVVGGLGGGHEDGAHGAVVGGEREGVEGGSEGGSDVHVAVDDKRHGVVDAGVAPAGEGVTQSGSGDESHQVAVVVDISCKVGAVDRALRGVERGDGDGVALLEEERRDVGVAGHVEGEGVGGDAVAPARKDIVRVGSGGERHGSAVVEDCPAEHGAIDTTPFRMVGSEVAFSMAEKAGRTGSVPTTAPLGVQLTKR